MESLSELIVPFVGAVSSGHTEVYNEFSLQHELGMHLRLRMPGYKVQFERNISSFFPSKPQCTKKEIDISIFSADKRELRYAIEVKYPRNGQYPEQMFSFCKDIAFAEELNAAGFLRTGLLILVDDPNFYRGSPDAIYGYFRGVRTLNGRVQKPTGAKDAEVTLCGKHYVRWKPVSGAVRYTLIEIPAVETVHVADALTGLGTSGSVSFEN